jgi:hypothetical protein
VTQDHSITWGALQFAGPVDPDADYLIEAIAEGTDLGNPVPVIEVVRSLLTDGSLAVLEGWDNREAPIRLRLSAPEGVAGPALAAAEAALMAELMATSKSPLIWVPPATDAATCVFDVVAARLDRDTSDGWDAEEKQHECRYYLLTLTCLPFARPEESTVVPALAPTPPVPTVVDIDDCTSAAGWTITAGPNVTALTGPTASGGSVNTGATVHYGNPAITPSYATTRPGSITMGSTPYLRVTATVVGGASAQLMLHYGGGSRPAVAVATSSLVAGAYDYYFTPGASLTSAIFYVYATPGIAEGSALSAKIHHIARTDTIVGAGTTRQQSRTATVSGSAPTQAAIRLFDATPGALGAEILVFTTRNTLWQPALRPYRAASAAPTVDSSMVSGARNTLSSSMVFRIPATQLTSGTYALAARMNVTTGGTLSWSARMTSPLGFVTVGSSVVVSGSTTVAVTSGYQVLNLARIPLPVLAAEADQVVELTLTGTANMTVDEAWLFGLHDGVLTWIQDSDSLSWIEIRSPELGAARPSVYGGTGAKGANSVSIGWKCRSFGAHRFTPGLMQVFTVTSSSLVSQSELEFYPRFHSHVLADAA